MISKWIYNRKAALLGLPVLESVLVVAILLK